MVYVSCMDLGGTVAGRAESGKPSLAASAETLETARAKELFPRNKLRGIGTISQGSGSKAANEREIGN